jgi:competence protein ComEC
VERLTLFESRLEWAIFFAICLTIACANVALEYNRFTELKERKFTELNASVTRQTLKRSKSGTNYWVLRLDSQKYGAFFTTTYEDLQDITGAEAKLTIITDNINFYDYLRGFYAPSFRISLLPDFDGGGSEKLYDRLVFFIADQHSDYLMRELFPAIFFAAPQSAELRSSVTKYAAAHLVALSGLHLGILSFILGALIGFPYRLLQSRFFPWRNAFFDLGATSIVTLGGYLIFTGTIPSLLRAYAMLVFGIFLVARHIKLFSFQTLMIVSILLVSFSPRMIFSVGFLLSVAGVFYIFLYLNHFGGRSKIVTAIGLAVYVFAAMLPIVHYYFPLTAHTQLFSPILTLLYTPFYIFEIAAHAIGFGDLLDPPLIAAFNADVSTRDFTVPLWLVLSYLALSLAAIFSRYIHYFFVAFLAVWLLWQYCLSIISL